MSPFPSSQESSAVVLTVPFKVKAFQLAHLNGATEPSEIV